MTHHTTHWDSGKQTLDPIRIASISVSLALNILALGLLMRPPGFMLPAQAPEKNPVVIVTPETIKKPVVVETRHEHRPRSVVAISHTRPVAATSHTTPVAVDRTVSQGEPKVVVDDSHVAVPVPPKTEASLTPIEAPAPTYPRDALRDGITGTVEIELLVGVEGRVVEAHVVHSSGSRQLDQAALDQVLRHWRFQPATREGVPIQALGRVPIVFKLDGR